MGLSGGLDELALADLVELIALGRKTGRLTLRGESGAEAGRLSLRDGCLVAAVCDRLRDEKAFYSLLSLQAGTFEFDPQAQLDEETCNFSMESLLMEGMRRIDEINRLRTALPAPAVVRLLGGVAGDAAEGRVLGHLGPGARSVGDIVEGVLVDGEIDEYDALKALARLRRREIVRVELPQEEDAATGPEATGLATPQPELER